MDAATRTAGEALDTGMAFMRYVRDHARDRKPTDLSLPQFRTLAILMKEPERSLTDIAEDLCVSPAAITKMADSLEERGLVKRTTGPEDRRRVTIQPTAAGRRIVNETRGALIEGIAERLDALSARELDTLANSLVTLRSLLAAKEVLA